MNEIKEICFWKIIANRDGTRRALGDPCQTLGLDKPCHDCDGSKLYASQIKCDAYIGRKNE